MKYIPLNQSYSRLVTISLLSTPSMPIVSENGLSLTQTITFVELCWQLRPYVDLFRPNFNPSDPNKPHLSSTLPPYALPKNVVDFLADALFDNHQASVCKVINSCWSSLNRQIWSTHDAMRSADHLIDTFLKYGSSHKIGTANLTAIY
jgi:hypothetical protein